jgi:hypothetical protein
MRALVLMLAAGLLLLAGAAALSLRSVAQQLTRPYDALYLPPGKVARVAALGHRTLVSDVYWLHTVQYMGDPAADTRGWDKLFGLVDLVTDLDPRHGYAYQTAGIVLGSAGRLDESDAILDKGIDKGPPYWSFPYYRSFNAWFYRGDLATGARYAEMAARRPGASTNISHLAVSLASKSGTPEDAIALVEELKTTVQDPVSAGRLDEQLKLAILERDAQALERAAARFEERHGRRIATLRELVSSGLLDELPGDPFGGEYVWHAGEGKVRSSANPFRFELREGQHQPGFRFRPPGQDRGGAPR